MERRKLQYFLEGLCFMKMRGINNQAYAISSFLLYFIQEAFRAVFNPADPAASSSHSYIGLIASKLPDRGKLPVV